MVISVLGPDNSGIVDALSKVVLDCGGNILDSRMAVMGSEFAVIMMVGGTWDAIAKIENQFPRLEKKLDLAIISRRTEARHPKPNTISYMVEVVAMDHPGIVHDISSFFNQRQINVEDLYTTSYPAPHTGTLMFSMNMTISVPGDLSIAALRGEFMDMCDALNLDAIIGPMK